MFGSWRVGRYTDEIWLVPGLGGGTPPVGSRPIEPGVAHLRAATWFSEGELSRITLLEIVRHLERHLAGIEAAETSWLLGRVTEALRDGRLSAHAVERTIGWSGAPQKSVELKGGETPSTPKTWFEVKVVDEEGRPVGGVEIVFTEGSRREKIKTNGSGVARWRDVEASSSFGSVRLASLKGARDALADRVSTPGSEKAPPGKPLVLGQDNLEASIEAETPETLVLVRPLVLVRLIGMHFDTNKSFLLDSAMRGIRQIVEVYRSDPAGTLLILGHTDTTGDEAYNLDLSVERALAVKAYLMDDAAAWEAWFGDAKPWQKRWGTREVNRMIAALPCAQSVTDFQQWSNETRGTELAVDGVAGPLTRKALIQAYMAIDGTTLPPGVDVAIHGCGEFFPRDDLGGDGIDDTENRRVEVYCFHHAVVPPVPGRKASKGEPEYAQWVKQVTREHDVEIGAQELQVRLHDHGTRPMTNVPYRVLFGDKIDSEGVSNDGWVIVFLPDNACPDTVRVEWGSQDDEGDYPFQLDVRVECSEGPERAQASAKLHNLGYLIASDAQYEQAVQDFQLDYGIDESGLDSGQLPPQTRDRLASIFETDCDATRTPKAPEPAKPEKPAETVFDSDGTGTCFL